MAQGLGTRAILGVVCPPRSLRLFWKPGVIWPPRSVRLFWKPGVVWPPRPPRLFWNPRLACPPAWKRFGAVCFTAPDLTGPPTRAKTPEFFLVWSSRGLDGLGCTLAAGSCGLATVFSPTLFFLRSRFFWADPVAVTGLSSAILAAATLTSFLSSSSKIGGSIRARFGAVPPAFCFGAVPPALGFVATPPALGFVATSPESAGVAEFVCGDDWK